MCLNNTRQDRMQHFTPEEIQLLHDASMKILSEVGVEFNSAAAVTIFEKNGFKTDGKKVFFTENDVLKALETTPSRFVVKSRNGDKNVTIGEQNYVLLPTGGASNVVTPTGEQRPTTFADYQTCCRLVQTSDQLDMTGFLMVQPNDLPPQTAHLDMVSANITLCDKPYMSATSTGETVVDSIEMAAIVWGGKEALHREPVMVAIANVMSPLQYSGEQAEVIMEMARYRQPVILTTMVLAGSSGPISLPGVLALQNAELLAGVVLTQLVGPGTPVVYSSTSAPMDMKAMTSAVGAPETAKLASGTIQMARFYKLPCRTGGALTDAHYPDAQAAVEGALTLSTAVRNGANFIFHACGQMGGYISMSFEKWLIDEELCRILRNMLTPMTITPETIDVETIASIGPGGQYLTHPKTFQQFRNLSQPVLFNRKDFGKWFDSGAERVDEVATKKLAERLEGYSKPPIDTGLEEALDEYVQRRKALRS